METPFAPLYGFRVQVCEYLAGAKRAVLQRDGVLLVSPAMHALMAAADPAELPSLLERIECVRVPWPPVNGPGLDLDVFQTETLADRPFGDAVVAYLMSRRDAPA